MAYTVVYRNDIGGHVRDFCSFQSLYQAKIELAILKKEFENECDDCGFLDCIEVLEDIDTHYEASDGEDCVEIQIVQDL